MGISRDPPLGISRDLQGSISGDLWGSLRIFRDIILSVSLEIFRELSLEIFRDLCLWGSLGGSLGISRDHHLKRSSQISRNLQESLRISRRSRYLLGCLRIHEKEMRNKVYRASEELQSCWMAMDGSRWVRLQIVPGDLCESYRNPLGYLSESPDLAEESPGISLGISRSRQDF